MKCKKKYSMNGVFFSVNDFYAAVMSNSIAASKIKTGCLCLLVYILVSNTGWI